MLEGNRGRVPPSGPGVRKSRLAAVIGLARAHARIGRESPTLVQASLRDLLTIASAKFIMSLTGLFCSIVFTVVLRSRAMGVR
jgi:hypothetical protein